MEGNANKQWLVGGTRNHSSLEEEGPGGENGGREDKGGEGGMIRGGNSTGNIKKEEWRRSNGESYAEMPSKLKGMAVTNEG